MDDNRKLWKEIEHLQAELRRVASRKGLNSPEANRASQEFRNKMQEYTDLTN